MNENIFNSAKEIFIDSSEPKNYLNLDSGVVYLETLEQLHKAPFKISVLYGPPGVGKTIMLKKFLSEHKDGHTFLYTRPFSSVEQFKNCLSEELFDNQKELFENLDGADDFSHFVILDEAQIYDKDFLEAIRLISDTNKIKFLLSMHTGESKELLSKEHFSTRIYKTIHMLPPAKKEFHAYIQKKLLSNQLFDLSKGFDYRRSGFVYTHTKGNYRAANRFLYTLFDILDYFYKNRPSQISINGKIPLKFFQMSAIELGLIDA